MYAFITGKSFPCLQVPECELNSCSITTGMGVLTAKISQFCTQAARLKAMRANNQQIAQLGASLSRSMQQSIILQQEIETWFGGLSPVFKPKRTQAANGDVLITYATRLLGILWTLHYTTRIFFSIGTLSCFRTYLGLQGYHFGDEEKDLITATSTTATDNAVSSINAICLSIPYNLGIVDRSGQAKAVPDQNASSSLYLIWPLALVAKCHLSTSTQSRVCHETLARIRSIYGIGLVDTALLKIQEASWWLY